MHRILFAVACCLTFAACGGDGGSVNLDCAGICAKVVACDADQT